MSKIFVGVDGCRGVDNCKTSWFAIALKDNGNPEASCFRNISELWDKYKKASMILIDIPIGLRDEGNEERKCDKEARAKLKRPRASSVFPAPCRPAIYEEEDYKKASNINRQVTGKGLTKQTFAIMHKIRDVDDFLRNNKSAKLRIRETHPEICFWALNGKRAMLYSKKEKELKGYEERKYLLESVCKYIYHKKWRKIDDLIKECTTPEYKKENGVARDDVLDALVAAITARLVYKNRFTAPPEKREKDHQGLRMEIVHCSYRKHKGQE